jgi:hypothetical protein
MLISRIALTCQKRKLAQSVYSLRRARQSFSCHCNLEDEKSSVCCDSLFARDVRDSLLPRLFCQTLLIAIALLVQAPHVYAWNSLGHKTVAEIAWRQLDAKTRQSIVDTIRRHPRFDKDFAMKAEGDDKVTQDHWIFQNAATWPDEIRKNKEYDRPSWHYIDLPIFLNPGDKDVFAGKLPVNISTDYPTKLPIDQYNILQAIAHCEAALKSKAPPEVKAVALCWLLHLVGDIHQPLHCSGLFSVERFPKGDKGGNEIPLRRGKNLHSLWDGLLGSDSKMSAVNKAANELSDKNHFSVEWETATDEKDSRKWAEESHAVCETVVYDPAILDAVRSAGDKIEPIELPVSYYTNAGEVARERMLLAGLRLAALLKLFGPH